MDGDCIIMAIKSHDWTTGTCGCIIRRSYDDVTDIISFDYFINKCPEHAGVTDDLSAYNIMRDENTRVGGGFPYILENSPNTIYDITQDGERVFKKGITVTWFYSGTIPDRVLNINITGITLKPNEISSIQNKLNTRYGISKVVITNNETVLRNR